MSLRFRLLVSIVGVLLAALMLGGVLACRQARISVQTEMNAALANGSLVVRQSLTIRGEAPPLSYILSLVRSFDGQRHLQSVLMLGNETRAKSRLAPYPASVPDWFDALIDVPSRSVRIPVAAQRSDALGTTLILRTEPDNEIGEVWNQTRDAFAVMVLFCGGTFVVVYILIGHALRFLSRLETGLRTISDDDYDTAIVEQGPPEFRSLARGFNQMARRLRAYAIRNAQLQDQIVRLQDEERAWIARDLHDEVGPYLFAIGVDAEAIPVLVDAKNSNETTKRADEIREAVVHIQRHIKAILRQLRSVEHLDFGLDAAIHDALAFWQRRYPDIRFDLDIRLDEAEIGSDVQEVVYRIVRESISNAVRHGQPRFIGVSIVYLEAIGLTVNIVDDGDGLPVGPLRRGMGLDGMSARIRGLNGTFEVGSRETGRGVRISAILPQQRPAGRVQVVV